MKNLKILGYDVKLNRCVDSQTWSGIVAGQDGGKTYHIGQLQTPQKVLLHCILWLCQHLSISFHIAGKYFVVIVGTENWFYYYIVDSEKWDAERQYNYGLVAYASAEAAKEAAIEEIASHYADRPIIEEENVTIYACHDGRYRKDGCDQLFDTPWEAYEFNNA